MDTLEIAKILIAKHSVTPNDAGCQLFMARYLEKLGFYVIHLPYGNTSNLWATHGSVAPLFVLAGHTDVVPSGDESNWETPPFQPVIRDGYLYGRGAVDMKTSLAAMMTACKHFTDQYPSHAGTLALLITSDEEGEAKNGTKKVLEHLQKKNIKIDYCLLGEPSSQHKLGDTIKHGRRGSITGNLTLFGKQGHVAYPDNAINAIHESLSTLIAIQKITWDSGSDFFPPTTLQIVNLQAGIGVTNVVPGELFCQFSLRFSPKTQIEHIKSNIQSILESQSLPFKLNWQLLGEPFLTTSGPLLAALSSAIKSITRINPKFSTKGGTSDGRFFAKNTKQVIEFGLVNDTIHQINESVKCNDLEVLSKIYQKTLENLLL